MRLYISIEICFLISIFISFNSKYIHLNDNKEKINQNFISYMKHQEINSNSMDSTLFNFENVLKKYAPRIYENLSPGLSDSLIAEYLKRLGINDSIIAKLYHWKNGIIETNVLRIQEFDFCSSGKFLPLNYAISLFLANKSKPSWKKSLFPIITTNAGDFLLFDTDKKSPTYGMILFYSAALLVTKPEPAYDNMISMFETLSMCYVRGIYKLNADMITLLINDEQEFIVSAEKNPKSTYWKQDN